MSAAHAPAAARLLFLAVTFLCTIASSPQARADTIHVSGTGISSMSGSFGWSLRSDDGATLIDLVSNSSAVNPVGPNCCRQIAPGSPIDLHFSGAGLDVLGTVTVSGVTYPALATIQVRGMAVAPTFQPAPASVSAPVTLSGGFTAFDHPHFLSANPLFTVPFTGEGAAEAVLTPSLGGYLLTSVTYRFDAQPVPEPTTLLLLATGLAGIGAAARRRGKVGRRSG